MVTWIVKLRGEWDPHRYGGGGGYPEAEHEVVCLSAADAVVVAKCRGAVYEDPKWRCVSCEMKAGVA